MLRVRNPNSVFGTRCAVWHRRSNLREGVTRLTDTTVEVLGTVALDRTFRWLCAEGVDMGGRPAKIKVPSFD